MHILGDIILDHKGEKRANHRRLSRGRSTWFRCIVRRREAETLGMQAGSLRQDIDGRQRVQVVDQRADWLLVEQSLAVCYTGLQ